MIELTFRTKSPTLTPAFSAGLSGTTRLTVCKLGLFVVGVNSAITDESVKNKIKRRLALILFNFDFDVKYKIFRLRKCKKV